MIKKMFTPELGQVFFDVNNIYKYEVPIFVIAMLRYIKEEIERIYFNIYQEIYDKENINFDSVKWREYYWGNNKKIKNYPNFEFENVKIKWYKRLGRSMSCNISQTEKKWVSWFNRCLKTLQNFEKKKINIDI